MKSEVKKRVLPEDKLIFVILGLILLVAIGVVLTWYFTKDKKLDEEIDKKPPVVAPVEEEDDDEEDDDIVEVVTVKPTPIFVDEDDDEEDPVVIPEVKEWELPTDLVEKIRIDREMDLKTGVLLDGKKETAEVKVERYNGSEWEDFATPNNKFSTNLAGKYRFVYTYDGVTKYQEFEVLPVLVTSVTAVDGTITNDDGFGEEFEEPERFTVITDNLKNIKVAVDGTNNTLYNITVNNTLAEHVPGRSLRVPVGILVDLNIDGYTGLTSITSPTNGVYVDLDGTTPWGADPDNAKFLVWLDAKEFEYDKEYDIELVINDETYFVTVLFKNNIAKVEDVTNIDNSVDNPTPSNQDVYDAVKGNMDNVDVEVDADDATEVTVNVADDLVDDQDAVEAITPIGLKVVVDQITGIVSITGTEAFTSYAGAEDFTVDELQGEILVWLDANNWWDNTSGSKGTKNVKLTIGETEVELKITFVDNRP